MAKKLDGGVPSGDPQYHVTSGNIITPVCGFENDAGAGKPKPPGTYGSPAEEKPYPTGSKMPGGSGKAIGAYFGSKNPGGGK